MELNWTTFGLEIVNFLILVWLLTRFLFKPVMDIINRRRSEVQNQLSAAETERTEAERLRVDYQGRLLAWEQEKQAAAGRLRDEISQERKRLLEALQTELARERERSGILNQRQIEDASRDMERVATRHGAAFCAGLLTRLAGPELETRIFEMVIEDLDTLPTTQREKLRHALSHNGGSITIASAFMPPEAGIRALEQKLTDVIAAPMRASYHQDPELISGLRIQVGDWLLQASLRDELKYFAAGSVDDQDEPGTG